MFWKRSDKLGAERKRKGEPEWVQNEPAEQAAPAPLPVLRPSLGADTVVSGRLSFTVPTRIDGTLRGEVRASDLLVVGEDGFVEGTVRARTLVVLGEVRGEVQGAERVEVGPGGRLMGTVETQSLVVKEGGCLDGDCRIAPPRATVHQLRAAPAANSA
jgi:cytoskeletal protein CcmA (bactofilin family)